MASIYEYSTAAGERRYRVVYRDDDRKQRQKRGFTTKRDAKLFIASVTTDINQGSYVAPSLGRALVADLAPDWLATKSTLKPSSYRPLESALRIHVLPRWGKTQIKDITTAQIKRWVAELSDVRSATTVIRCVEVLRGILGYAIDDGLIRSNPCDKVDNLPRKKSKPHVYLTHQQVFRLAHASKYPAIVLTLAYTGLRWGEASGMRVQDINFARHRLMLENNAVNVGGKIIEGTLKNHKKRSVPFPAFLTPWIQGSIGDKEPHAYVFGDGLKPLSKGNGVDSWWPVAVNVAGIPKVTPHDLRHTAASFAVAAGANVKAVQRMLGHASAAMTLDVYADLFDDDLDAVSTALDQAVMKSNVAKLLPLPDLIQKKTG